MSEELSAGAEGEEPRCPECDGKWSGHAGCTLALLDRLRTVERERNEAQADLEMERRKDHAYEAWTNGYKAAMEDHLAGRTALWPTKEGE